MDSIEARALYESFIAMWMVESDVPIASTQAYAKTIKMIMDHEMMNEKSVYSIEQIKSRRERAKQVLIWKMSDADFERRTDVNERILIVHDLKHHRKEFSDEEIKALEEYDSVLKARLNNDENQMVELVADAFWNA